MRARPPVRNGRRRQQRQRKRLREQQRQRQRQREQQQRQQQQRLFRSNGSICCRSTGSLPEIRLICPLPSLLFRNDVHPFFSSLPGLTSDDTQISLILKTSVFSVKSLNASFRMFLSGCYLFQSSVSLSQDLLPQSCFCILPLLFSLFRDALSKILNKTFALLLIVTNL